MAGAPSTYGKKMSPLSEDKPVISNGTPDLCFCMLVHLSL